MTGSTPRLLLDMQAVQTIRFTERGIGRYVVEFSRALMQRDGLVCGLAINPNMALPLQLPAEHLASGLLCWNSAATLDEALAGGPLAYAVLSAFEIRPAEQLMPPHVARSRVPVITLLYDLIPLVLDHLYLTDPHYARWYRARLESVKRSDLILAISEHTRQDAIEHLGCPPGRVVNIGAGISEFFRPAQPDEDPLAVVRAEMPEIRRPFVLCVSGFDFRKNTERLIAAFAQLPPDVRRSSQLVVTCSLLPYEAQLWEKYAASVGLRRGELVLTNKVSDSLLRALYQSAELMVFPSLYEGFGLPVAEALACDCPVLTSNSSSLPELLNWEPATFDPTNVTLISESIERGLTDGVFRGQLTTASRAAPRQTWASVAEKTDAALRQLDVPRARPAGVRRRRVALVSPLPPIRSGVAEYSARVAAELAETCDLDLLFTAGSDRNLIDRTPALRVFPLAALGRTLNPSAYDAIIYAFGNSAHHHETFSYALQHPGILWLHDVRLVGFYLTYAQQRVEGDGMQFLLDRVRQFYGHRLERHLDEFDPRSMADYLSLGIGMTPELVRASPAIVVNSGFARNLLRLDQPPRGSIPPIEVIPHAVNNRLPFPAIVQSNPTLIGSFGLVGPPKGPASLMSALPQIRQRIDARLVFVGPIPDGYRKELGARSRALGVEQWVEFTGDVDDTEYAGWLKRCGVAVQIRHFTNGESSGAVHDCIAAGLPVVTNIESCRELPPGTVELVEDSHPTHIADHVLRLLLDPEAAAQQTAAQRKYATSWTYNQVAARLMSFVEEQLNAIPRQI